MEVLNRLVEHATQIVGLAALEAANPFDPFSSNAWLISTRDHQSRSLLVPGLKQVQSESFDEQQQQHFPHRHLGLTHQVAELGEQDPRPFPFVDRARYRWFACYVAVVVVVVVVVGGGDDVVVVAAQIGGAWVLVDDLEREILLLRKPKRMMRPLDDDDDDDESRMMMTCQEDVPHLE